jgi:hypothetical protein
VTDAEPTTDISAADDAAEDTDVKEGIRDRSVREVVERTRDVIRKTRELLENSRELLDRVRQRDRDGAEDEPGEHDADEMSDDNAAADARPVDGRA